MDPHSNTVRCDRQKTGSVTWLAVLCVWPLILATLVFEKQIGPAIGPIDAFGLLKLSARLGTTAILGCAIVCVWRGWPRRYAFLAFIPLFGYVLLAIGSTTWSPLPGTSLWQTLGLLSVVLLALSFAVVCRTRRHLSVLLFHLTAALLAATVMSLVIHYAFPQVGRIVRDSQGLMHPTNASATSSLGLILVVCSCFLGKWRWTRWLLIPSLLCHSWVIVISTNRLSLVLTLLILLLAFVSLARRSNVALLALSMGILLAGYATFDPGLKLMTKTGRSVFDYMGRGQTQREMAKLSRRDELWRKMWDSYLVSPWIGHGFFMTSKTGSIEVWGQRGNRTAHNFVLQVIVSTGGIGLVLLLIGLTYPMLRSARGLMGPRGDGRLLVFLLLTLLWYIGWGTLNESIAGPLQPETVVFFALLGAAVGLASVRIRSLARKQDHSGQLMISPAS